MLEQITRVRRPHRLRSTAIGDSGARSRQHHEGWREIKGGGGGVHPLDLTTFMPDVSDDVLNLIFGEVSRF
jgi:hypothetical protein